MTNPAAIQIDLVKLCKPEFFLFIRVSLMHYTLSFLLEVKIVLTKEHTSEKLQQSVQPNQYLQIMVSRS